MKGRISIYEFGRQLIKTEDLDPTYTVLWGAQLEPALLRSYLLAYFSFYHMGTAAWIADGGKDYWQRMEMAAGSKEYPRGSERRHYRGTAAKKSVAWLKQRGVDFLFARFRKDRPLTVGQVIAIVREWQNFGPWIAFKVADILERLDLCPVNPVDAHRYLFESPYKGAVELWKREYPEDHSPDSGVIQWAIGRLLKELGKEKAPPRFERRINVMECETVLCKMHSYTNGKYHVEKDIEEVHHALLKFPKSETAKRLLKGGQKAGLWKSQVEHQHQESVTYGS